MQNRFMQIALNEAKKAWTKDEVPIGAVLVFEGNVVAKAHNLVQSKSVATNHAELLVINKAMTKSKSKLLLNHDLYVTLEPCSMCAGALVLSRISNLYFGAYDYKTGACGSVFNIASSNQLNHKINVVGGVMEAECSQLIKDFFKQKRK